jgi:NAD(P)-dependent dehydrogenase (short-subunit alcohol dehydrogenase family)
MIGSNANRIGIVTGSSSGIGFETALTLARNGFYTYATMCSVARLNHSNPDNRHFITISYQQACCTMMPLEASPLPCLDIS